MRKFVIFLLITAAARAEIPEFACVTSELDLCTVGSIFRSPTDSNFHLTAPDPAKIERLVIKASQISVWTSVCTTFPNLQKIVASRVGIKQLAPGAFDNCTNLRHLDFSFNHIKEVPIGLLSPMTHLETLYLYNNNLTYFPADSLKNLKELKKFALISNQIFEIDEDKIVANCPALTDLWFNDNNLRCDRIAKIKSTLKRKNVNPFTYIASPRNRIETVRKEDEHICLSDAQWIASIIQSVAPSQLQDISSALSAVQQGQLSAFNASLLERLFKVEDKININEQETEAKWNENVRQIEQVQERIVNISANLAEKADKLTLDGMKESVQKIDGSLGVLTAEVEMNLTIIEEILSARILSVEEAQLNASAITSVAELRLEEQGDRSFNWWLLFVVVLINLAFLGIGMLFIQWKTKIQVLSYFEEKSNLISSNL